MGANVTPLLNQLVEELADRSRHARDHFEIAAVLESMGWTDRSAAELGYDSVFDLAREVHVLIRRTVPVRSFVPRRDEPWLERLTFVVRYFLRGTMFAMPMAVSIAAFLVLRYSLWASQYLSLELATSVVLGTILSFVVTGGFTQAVARRGMMYLGQEEHNLSRRVTFKFVRLGVAVVALVGVTVAFVNVALDIFPPKMIAYMVVYYGFLSVMWLSVTVLYMLQREFLFTVIITAGIAAVAVLHELFRLDIVRAQIVALTGVAGASLFTAIRLFRAAERAFTGEVEVSLPRMSLIVYTALPFFGYGFLYFAFLFIDRVIGWSASSAYMPYFIWFRGDYELGHDFALLTLIIPLGMVEVTIRSAMRLLTELQSEYQLGQVQHFNRRYQHMYVRQLLIYALSAAMSGLILYQVINLVFAGVYAGWRPGTVGTFVFRWAVVGYVVLAGGLMNTLFLFCLSQPLPVLRSLTTAAVVNTVVAFVASRVIAYHWAVLGLASGSAVFLALTTREVLRVLGNLDFYVYYPV